MSRETIAIERRDGLAIVTLNAPPLNLVSLDMTAALDDAMAELSEDPGVRALLLQGSGDKAFCAGSDIGEFDAYMKPHAAIREKLYAENAMYSRLAGFPKPTVAALHGVAFGGGLELAVCCDLIIADPGARFALPETRLGVFPGSGGTVRVTRRIGRARTLEMIYLGEPIDARTALDWGLVNRVSAPGAVRDESLALAERLASGPLSQNLAKAAVDFADSLPEPDAIARMLPLIDQAFCSEDCREGVDAFRQKRPPRFKGR